MPRCHVMFCSVVEALLRSQRCEKKVKLALTIYHDFMQSFLSDFERSGKINRGVLAFASLP